VICELNSSLVVSGWDESKWAAYGFTNTDPDDETDTLDDEQEDATLDEMEDEYDLYLTDWGLEDRLASGGRYDVVPQEHPIWDPRLYFLQLTDLRIRTVRKEWSYLVHKIVASVKSQVIVSLQSVAISDGDRTTTWTTHSAVSRSVEHRSLRHLLPD
jgi:hypothetical protein